jgi:hypothetical protein
MSAEIRFACPQCGQHYTADAQWQKQSMTCSACQAQFTVQGRPVFGSPNAPPLAQPEGNHPLLGTSLGLLTPLACALVGGICSFPVNVAGLLLGPMGGLLHLLGLAAGVVGIAYLTRRFAKWFVAKWGDEALAYYVRSAGVAFLVWPGLAVGASILLASRSENEGAGLALFLVTPGAFFASLLLAAPWFAGLKWAAWHS